MTASVTLVEELATSLENAHHLHKSEIKTVTDVGAQIILLLIVLTANPPQNVIIVISWDTLQEIAL